MLMSGLFGEDLFDDFWGFPTHELANIDKHLYGKNARTMMATDVNETEISASKGHDQEKKDKHGKIIRQERYAGSLQRSFYVGDAVKVEDVKAKYEDGVLKLFIPKKELKALPGNNTIAIEG